MLGRDVEFSDCSVALSLSLLFHMSSAPARHICSSSLSFVILANIFRSLFLDSVLVLELGKSTMVKKDLLV